ncbi:TrkH family potassium uptake protein [Coprothermobacter platensis]|uniref:TrkH family potassium uptake protein n=1 Tax=Coprothermobacter platensis TaxID=108819 RepID=UPI00036F91B1|nr:potassium transporter TrkG [Coprothermobacter platensis]
MEEAIKSRRLIVRSFALVIIVGAVLLTLPIASRSHSFTDFVDALFTSTSAVCVTGLVVKDTWDYFNFFGQFIIMLLIQFGGLSYLTITTFTLLLLTGARIGLRTRLTLASQFNVSSMQGIVKLLGFTVRFSFALEALGALLLSFKFVPYYLTQRGLAGGIWASIFDSVSAFNNAGFDVHGGFRSLSQFVQSPIVNLTIMGLIIAGGLGFVVWSEIFQRIRERKFVFSLHTRIVLTVTAVLIISGAALIAIFEWNNPKTLGALPLSGKIWAALFQSVTPRTAGFATINHGYATMPTLLVTMLLMFIGGSPGGTAGGIKTTTFFSVFQYIKAVLTGSNRVHVAHRTIKWSILDTANAILILNITIAVISIFLMSIFEPQLPLQRIAFEVFSALGTVGLTTGITPTLTVGSKIVLILTMFIGRVGVFTILTGYIFKPELPSYTYPEEDIIVG